MTKQQLVDYLRTQASWINHLAQEVEEGKEVTCEWAVDLEVPKINEKVSA